MLIKECLSSTLNFICTRYASYCLVIHRYFWFICSVPDKSLWLACRFSGGWLISTLFPKFATEIWSLKIYWFVYVIVVVVVSVCIQIQFILKTSNYFWLWCHSVYIPGGSSYTPSEAMWLWKCKSSSMLTSLFCFDVLNFLSNFSSTIIFCMDKVITQNVNQ